MTSPWLPAVKATWRPGSPPARPPTTPGTSWPAPPPAGTGSPITSPWLFPGGMPGQPITPSRLGERLRALGIRAMPGRRAALIDLAAQLPAAVLADCLNLSPGTAVRWMHQAGADWNRYAADIARTRDHQP